MKSSKRRSMLRSDGSRSRSRTHEVSRSASRSLPVRADRQRVGPVQVHPRRVGEHRDHRHGHLTGVSMGQHEGRVGEHRRQRAELLQVLGALQHPALAAAGVLEHLQDPVQVLVVGCLVRRPVVRPPGRHRGERVEQQRRAVQRQQVDLLVGVPGRHLVHALHLGDPQLRHVQAERAAFDPGLDRSRRFARRRERFDRLPVGQGPQRGIGRHQVVQVRRARAGQAGDDDRPLDRGIERVGVVPQVVLDEQPVGQQLHQLRVHRDDAEAGQARLVAQRGAQDLERFLPAVRAEGGGTARPLECIGAEALGVSSTSSASAAPASSTARASSEKRGAARSSRRIGAGTAGSIDGP